MSSHPHPTHHPTPHPEHKRNLPVGIVFTVITWTLFAILNACVKGLSNSVPTHIVLFFQNFFSFLLFVPLICVKPAMLKTRRLPLIIWRTLFGIGTYYLLFWSVKLIPLADASLLNNTAPSFVPFILLFWGKQKVTKKQLGAILLGFIGVALILKPGAGIFSIGSVIALLSGISSALTIAALSHLVHEAYETVIVYYLFISSLLLFPFVWLGWAPVSSTGWLILLITGILMYIIQIFFTQAYKYAPAVDLGPFSYSFVIVSGLIDWWIWNDVPTLFSVIGIVLVIIGGTFTILFSSARAKNQVKNVE